MWLLDTMTLTHVTLLLITVSLVTSGTVTWTQEEPGVQEAQSSQSVPAQGREAQVDNPGYFGYAVQYPKTTLQHQDVPQYPTSTSEHHHHHQDGSQHQPSYSQSPPVNSFGQPTAYHYTIYPHSQHYPHYAPTYTNHEEYSDGWLCRTFGGICDDGHNRQGFDEDTTGAAVGGGIGIVAAVVAALKALKLLPILKFLPVLLPLLPLLPLLIPLALILVIPVFIAAWFLPVIPVLVTARRMSLIGVRSFRDTLLSDSCLERLSCEVSKVSRAHEFVAPWVQKVLDKASHQADWVDRVTKAGRSAGTTVCETYTCHPMTSLKKSLKMK